MEDFKKRIEIYIKSNKKNKDDLFRYIWNEYHRKLIVFIRTKIGSNKENTEDIIQDIMLRLFENIEKYNPFYSFNTWVYSIARNCFIDRYRKENIETIPEQKTTEALFMETKIRNPEEELINKEISNKIDSFLVSLNEVDREIAFLKFYENMKYKDISKIVEIPEGTVKSKINIIRNNLKKELEIYVWTINN